MMRGLPIEPFHSSLRSSSKIPMHERREWDGLGNEEILELWILKSFVQQERDEVPSKFVVHSKYVRI